MSVWDKFNKLTKLDFNYEGVAPGITPAIYANSKNQVDIVISVEVKDVDGEPLNLKKEDFKDLLYFCDYITGEKINSPWSISNNINEYTKPVLLSNSHIDKKSISGPQYIHRYLSCSESNIQKVFSVGIHVPGIGDFNTSKNGTNTPNCPKGGSGSPFKSPKSLIISTLPPIDYSLRENIKVINMPESIDDFDKVATDMQIVFGKSEWLVGISSKTKFTIHPNKKGYVFHLGDPRRNKTTFPANFPNNVLPDMVRGTGGNSYDTQFVFVNRDVYGIAPPSSITAVWNQNDGIYNYNIRDDHHHWKESLVYGFITVNICNHRIPWSNMRQFRWSDEGRIIKVDVTDNYGNSGVIEIKAPNNDDPWPKLYVNGE